MCPACGDSHPVDEGVSCRVARGMVAHFVCKPCFAAQVASQITHTGIGEFLKADCLITCSQAGGENGCPAEPFSINDVARGAPDEFIAFLDVRREVFEGKLQAQLEAQKKNGDRGCAGSRPC